jgi:hypothetical protein
VYKGKHFSGNLKLGIFAIFAKFHRRPSVKLSIFAKNAKFGGLALLGIWHFCRFCRFLPLKTHSVFVTIGH